MKPSAVLVRLSGAALVGAVSSPLRLLPRRDHRARGGQGERRHHHPSSRVRGAPSSRPCRRHRIAPDQVESYLRQNNARILQEAVDDPPHHPARGRPRHQAPARIRPGRDRTQSRRRTTSPTTRSSTSELRREGMSLDDLKRNIERSVLRRQVLSRELSRRRRLTEADARRSTSSTRANTARARPLHLQEIVVPRRRPGPGRTCAGPRVAKIRRPGPRALHRRAAAPPGATSAR